MRLLIFSIIVLFSANFSTIFSQKLNNTNPTSFIFHSNIKIVKEGIIKLFNQFPGYRFMKLEYLSKDTILTKKAKELFQDNENDFYLSYSSSIGKSKMYVNKNGQFLDYYAEFYLHLTEINDNQTRIDVVTINPRVAIGKKIFPSLIHFVRMIKTKTVSPSTIEEYEILLQIGEALKESGMPELQAIEKREI